MSPLPAGRLEGGALHLEGALGHAVVRRSNGPVDHAVAIVVDPEVDPGAHRQPRRRARAEPGSPGQSFEALVSAPKHVQGTAATPPADLDAVPCLGAVRDKSQLVTGADVEQVCKREGPEPIGLPAMTGEPAATGRLQRQGRAVFGQHQVDVTHGLRDLKEPLGGQCRRLPGSFRAQHVRHRRPDRSPSASAAPKLIPTPTAVPSTGPLGGELRHGVEHRVSELDVTTGLPQPVDVLVDLRHREIRKLGRRDLAGRRRGQRMPQANQRQSLTSQRFRQCCARLRQDDRGWRQGNTSVSDRDRQVEHRRDAADRAHRGSDHLARPPRPQPEKHRLRLARRQLFDRRVGVAEQLDPRQATGGQAHLNQRTWGIAGVGQGQAELVLFIRPHHLRMVDADAEARVPNQDRTASIALDPGWPRRQAFEHPAELEVDHVGPLAHTLDLDLGLARCLSDDEGQVVDGTQHAIGPGNANWNRRREGHRRVGLGPSQSRRKSNRCREIPDHQGIVFGSTILGDEHHRKELVEQPDVGREQDHPRKHPRLRGGTIAFDRHASALTDFGSEVCRSSHREGHHPRRRKALPSGLTEGTLRRNAQHRPVDSAGRVPIEP